MSEAEILSGRVETVNFAVQTAGEEVLTSPVYRLVLDVSGGSSVGRLQNGYYINVNYSVFFVAKQTIQVTTLSEAEKVFAFLAKTKLPFTISVRRDKTNSGHQYVTLDDVTDETEFYTLKEFRLFHGLWRTIEGELFENLYSPSIARFTSEKLDWYIKLIPEHPLQFGQATSVSCDYFTTQGHLDIYKVQGGPYVLPYYLYNKRRKMMFFNHSLEGDLYVIPLGPEMRIVNLSRETNITSPDHETIHLDVGEYLLVHPRPKRDKVD